MKFLIDAQLPITLARWLRGRGCDAVHVLELDAGQWDDRAIWELAIDEARIVVSKDEDFFILATRPHSEGRLLWLRMGNCRTIDLISSLNRRWEFIDQAFADQQRIVEVR
jgi:predicted nuclease of predicted toxin-antitoxin system